MKLFRLSISSSVLLAACTAGGVAWSPKACGCIEPWMDLAAQLGRGAELESPESAIPAVRDALTRRFVGRQLTNDALPDMDRSDICEKSRNGATTCRWWLWQSGGRERGVAAHFITNSSGTVTRIEVQDIYSKGLW